MPQLKLGESKPAEQQADAKPRFGFGLDLTKAKNIQQENLTRVDLMKQD
jgi:hypothetical protein